MIALQGDSINETVKCANQIFGLENSFYPWQPAWNDFCANNDSTPYINGCSSWCNNYTIVAFLYNADKSFHRTNCVHIGGENN